LGFDSQLTAEENALIGRHLPFYEALARGDRRPTSKAQERFVAVFSGRARAESAHEMAYLKYRRRRNEERKEGESQTPQTPETEPGQYNYPNSVGDKFDVEYEPKESPWA